MTDALAGTLSRHLKHDEDETLPLIDATVTPQQWQHYGEVHRTWTGPDAPRLTP